MAVLPLFKQKGAYGAFQLKRLTSDKGFLPISQADANMKIPLSFWDMTKRVSDQ